MDVEETKGRIEITSQISRDESYNEESILLNPSSKNTPAPRDVMGGLDSSNIDRSIKAKPAQFRPLYEELDHNCYFEGAVRMKNGEDGRSAVEDTTIYPYSAHGRLVMMFNGKTSYGSGTLISSRYALTAAHNVYSRRFRKEADSIYFIPALNGRDCPYGIIGVRRHFYPNEFKEGRTEDYAILELEEDIGNSVGIINMKIFEEHEINGIEYSIYGYPGYINGVDNNLQYGMSGLVTVHHQDKTLLKYQIDTDKGQGGSSICYYSQQEDKYFTIGVHVRESKELGYSEGILLTPERIGKIEKWMRIKAIDTKHNLQGLISEIYGRDECLNELRHHLILYEDFKVLALCGVGGVGKSAIALKFGTESIGRYDYIWWIDSETEDSFKISIISLADTLGIQGNAFQDKLNNLKVHINSNRDSFLLIFDNLEDEELVKSLIESKGHFIITTRLEQTKFMNIEVRTLSNEASVQLLSSRLPDESHEDLQTLAYFLQYLPLELVQSAAYIRKTRIEVINYIQYFSSIMKRDDKLRNIVSKNIDSLSEEAQDILRIVCIGNCDNIPYDMLYQIFSYKYNNTTQNHFNYYLGEIVRFNWMSYDIKKDLLRIHRVVHQDTIIKLSNSIDDELINHYSHYLFNNFKTKFGIYEKNEVDQILYLTLHAVSFLTEYRNKDISTRNLILYTRVASSYMDYYLDNPTSKKYIEKTEALLRANIDLDSYKAQSYHNLAALYYKLVEYKKAEEYYIRSLTIREAVLPSNHPDLATTYNNLGNLYRSMREYKKSEEYYIRSLMIIEALLPPIHQDLALSYNNLALLYSSMGEYNKSEKYYIKSLMIREAVLNSNHPDLATSYGNLGNLYSSMGEYQKSEKYYIKSLMIGEAVLPYNHPDLASSYSNLGNLYYSMGEYQKSENYNIKSLKIYEALFHSNHPDLALSYNNLGNLYESMGEYQKSEKYYIKSLKIYEDVLPSNHPNLATIYGNLGNVYSSKAEYQKSKEYMIKSLRIREAVLPYNHPDLASSYSNLGNLYYSMGEYQKSENYNIKSLKIYEALFHSNHPDLALTYNNLGKLYESMGEYQESEEHYIKSLMIYEALFHSNHPDLATSYGNLGSLYESMGEYNKSEEHYIKSLKIYEDVLPSNHPNLATTYNNLGNLYFSMGEYNKSEQYYIKSLMIREAVLHSNHTSLATTYNSLGNLYYSMGEYQTSEEYYIRSLMIYEAVLPWNHPDLGTSYGNLGSLYSSMGEYNKSEEYSIKAQAIREARLPSIIQV